MTSQLVIHPIEAFNDNYIWCIHDGCHAVVVDPGDAAPVITFLNRHNLRLESLLITHHHHDHVGGITTLVEEYPGIEVVGPYNSRIAGLTRTVKSNDTVRLTHFGLTLDVFEVPGHTLDHIAYYGRDMLFCGDTLFSAGCGRLFEGTPAQMLESLNKLSSLPDHTQVYCTHEYTLSNLAFARAVEPDNEYIKITTDKVMQMREAGLPSLPTNLGIEKQINPFLRTGDAVRWPQIQNQTGKHISNEEQAFAAVRAWKDAF